MLNLNLYQFLPSDKNRTPHPLTDDNLCSRRNDDDSVTLDKGLIDQRQLRDLLNT